MGRSANFVAADTDVFTGNGEVNFVETIIITMSIDLITGFTIDSFAVILQRRFSRHSGYTSKDAIILSGVNNHVFRVMIHLF